MVNKSELVETEFYNYISKKLLKSNLDKSDLMGAISMIIYSKDIFNSNKDIKPFVELLFDKNFPVYIIKSRTLIVAKSSRYINEMSTESLKNTQKKAITYLKIENPIHNPNISNTPKSGGKKSQDKLNTWMKGL